jgi:hypothetical protein
MMTIGARFCGGAVAVGRVLTDGGKTQEVVDKITGGGRNLVDNFVARPECCP